MNMVYALHGNCSARPHRALYIPGMNAGVFRAIWIKPRTRQIRIGLSLFALTSVLSPQYAWSGNSGIVAMSSSPAKLRLSSLSQTSPRPEPVALSTIMRRLNSGSKPSESQLIASAMRVVSTMYGVPNGLLRAISLTESGLSGQPWPWTLNVYGQAYRYTSEKQTVTAVRKFLAKGITLVDIGPMQVDWHYHGWRFGSVRAAANPLRNVAVAARILRDAYTQTGSWTDAIGQYHGGGMLRQQTYIHQVMTRWHAPSGDGMGLPVQLGGINLIPAKTNSIVAMTNTSGSY